MSNSKKSLFLIFSLLVSVVAQAKDIAILNQEFVLFSSTVAELENARLQSDFGEVEAQRIALQSELAELEKRFDTDRDIMTEEQIAALQQEGASVQQQLSQVTTQLAQAQQQRQQAFVQQYQPALVQAIEIVLENNDFDLILDHTAVIWAQDSMDISADVLQAFNQLTEEE